VLPTVLGESRCLDLSGEPNVQIIAPLQQFREIFVTVFCSSFINKLTKFCFFLFFFSSSHSFHAFVFVWLVLSQTLAGLLNMHENGMQLDTLYDWIEQSFTSVRPPPPPPFLPSSSLPLPLWMRYICT
jgi:hypothetical protein